MSNKLPQGWEEKELSEVCTNISQTHKFSKDTQVVFVNTGDVLEGNFLHNNYSKISDLPGQAKKLIQKNDILFSEIRPKNKRYAFVEKDCNKFVVSTKFMVIRNFENMLPKYLYLFLTSEYIIDIFNIIAESRSGTFPQITFSAIKNEKIKYPSDKHEQKRIADILSAFDDKIEINNEINQTLEEMASALFKEWFENFNFPNNQGKPYKDSGGEMKPSELGEIPIDWTIGTLNNIASFKNGKTSPKRDDSFLIPVFGSNGNIGKAQKFNFEDVIIIGRVGSYCGSLYYSLGKCWVTDNAMIGKSKFGFGQFHLLYLLKRLNLNNRSTGSGQPLLNQSILNSIEIVIPVKEYLQKFSNLLEPIFEQIQQNQQQNQILKQQRDALLPKLISGEIRV